MKHKHRELAKKSFYWRIFSSSSLLITAWIMTGSLATGGLLALVDAIITMIILYPVFELWWERNRKRV